MPSGIYGSMNRLFRNYLDSFVIVYIDDILIYSKNEGNHMNHLRVVFQVLKEHQLFAKYSKCEFWLRSVTFHGHIISCDGVEIDPSKMEAVKNWPRPLTTINIRSFLGLVGYYRRFMDVFASIESPLTKLTEKRKKFGWSGACEKSLQSLRC